MPDKSDLPLLELEGVTHRYGPVTAVDNVSLSVMRNEMVCLLGPSGCGKSTLLRVAAGLERPSAGRVRMGGVIATGPDAWIPPERRQVGLVFQEPTLFPHLSVAENVRFGLDKMSASARDRKVHEGLEQLGMAEYADAYPHTLSGGQQQRVALARAMAPSPRVMLLDEPFSSLDARLREQIREETLHVLKGSGTATLMVTHDPEEALFMADRIALMREGRIEQCGTPAQLYCRPVNAFVATFFGSTNRCTGRVDNGQVVTPLGPLPSPVDYSDGTELAVLVRHEAIKVVADETPGAQVGTVILARLLGRQSLVHFRVEDGERHLHLHARVPGVFLPSVGTQLALMLDPDQVFAFPAAG